MKVPPRFQAMALVALGLLTCSNRAGAQNIGLGVEDSPDPVLVNSTLTYTITLTNQTSQLLAGVFVTNVFPPSVTILTATPGQGTANIQASRVIFSVGQMNFPQVVQMQVTVQPTALGYITNSIAVSAAPFALTLTNVPTLVSNIAPVVADLAVAITGPSPPVLTNDWITYGVTVSNLGPSSASGVVLSNTFSAGVGFIVASPTNQPSTNGSVFFTLGTLPNQAVRNFLLTVQATNAGQVTLGASVTAAGFSDPNAANNSASANITVTNAIPGLVASILPPQRLNLQSGLLEQSIVLSNGSPATVGSARVLVSGLGATNRLFNAVGTNNGMPFVTHGAALSSGQTVNLLLQFFPRRSTFAFSNSQLHAAGTAPANLAPPASPGSLVTNVTIFALSTGGMLLEFPALTGRVYSVVYSDDPLFSNALAARPTMVAPANFSQWIDYGPPATIAHPTNSNSRFYRVYLTP